MFLRLKPRMSSLMVAAIAPLAFMGAAMMSPAQAQIQSIDPNQAIDGDLQAQGQQAVNKANNAASTAAATAATAPAEARSTLPPPPGYTGNYNQATTQANNQGMAQAQQTAQNSTQSARQAYQQSQGVYDSSQQQAQNAYGQAQNTVNNTAQYPAQPPQGTTGAYNQNTTDPNYNAQYGANRPTFESQTENKPTQYQKDDLIGAAEGVFGKGAEGLAGIIEDILRDQGEPNAYIIGREASGAFIFGVRYGSGTLHHAAAGQKPVYWTGPSLGFDAGANGGNTFILVYNLYDIDALYRKSFAAGEGAAYLVGGFHTSYLRKGDVVLIPVRLGLGVRLGANVGYMKFTEKRDWLPF